MSIFIKTLQVLLAVALVLLAYYVTVWVLGLLGLRVPEQILVVIFVILGLAAAIEVLSGGATKWFKSGS